jgi:hypothetical protein
MTVPLEYLQAILLDALLATLLVCSSAVFEEALLINPMNKFMVSYSTCSSEQLL